MCLASASRALLACLLDIFFTYVSEVVTNFLWHSQCSICCSSTPSSLQKCFKCTSSLYKYTCTHINRRSCALKDRHWFQSTDHQLQSCWRTEMWQESPSRSEQISMLPRWRMEAIILKMLIWLLSFMPEITKTLSLSLKIEHWFYFLRVNRKQKIKKYEGKEKDFAFMCRDC